MKYQLATIIVTDAVANNLRQLAYHLDKDDMVGMFTTPLSATGSNPPTHWVSSGCVPKPLVKLMRNPTQMYNVAKAAWAADGEVFPYTKAQVTNALSKCTIDAGADDSEEPLPTDPLDVIAAAGLQMIKTAAPP
jgi:hypothetical protein